MEERGEGAVAVKIENVFRNGCFDLLLMVTKQEMKKKVTAVFGSVGVGIIFDVIMFAVGDGGTRKRQTGTGLVRLFATEMMVIGGISSVTTLLWRCRRNRWLFHSVKFQLP